MIAWFARNSVAANLLMIAIMGLGIWTLATDRIPLEVFPDTPSRFLSVTVPYPGATPEEVEEMIVLRIEEAITQVPGIKRVFSTSSSSGGTVNIEMEDADLARQIIDDVKIRVDAIPNFPALAERPNIQHDDFMSSVISVVLSADMAERDLRRLGEQVRDEIAALPEITHSTLTGVRPYEISIEIPEATLRKYGLTLDRISTAIRSSAIDLPAGVVQTEAGDVSIRTRGRAYTGADYARIVVLTRADGTKLTLGEIATINDGFNENPLIARLDGRRCVMINVMREGGQNAIHIAEAVKKYINEASKRYPQGVKLEFWNDRSKIVKGRITLLLQNARSSLILVFICVGLFLRLDAVFWVAIGMVMSFLGAFALMPFFDMSINLSSVFGFILVLGIVVDDAIVTSEQVDTMRQQGMKPLDAAIEGTRRLAVPITFGVLTTIAAFVPMLIGFDDFSKSYLSPIAIIFVCVMLLALMETKLILPSHLAHRTPIISRLADVLEPLHQFSERSLKKFVERVYRPTLRFCLHFRYAVLSVFFGGLGLLLAIFMSGRIAWTMFPRVASERITCNLVMLDGTPFETTDGHISRIYAIAEQMRKDYVGADGRPVVRAIISSTGATMSSRGSGSSGSHFGEVTIETFGPEERSMQVNTIEMSDDWRKRILDAYGGPIVGAEEMNFRAEIMRGSDPIDIQLSGTNPDELLALSEQIKAQLNTIAGVFDVSDSLDSGRNEIQLRLKPEAQQFGITVNDLARQVRGVFFGEEVQRIQRGRNEVKVMLRFPKADRQNLATLESMRVRGANGLEIPFARVAEAKVGKSFSSIKRVDRRRALNISADVNKNTTNPGAVREALTPFLEDLLSTHPHIQWSFEGEARAERESKSALWLSALLVFFALYALVAIPLKSYLQPLIVLVLIPFGIVGAVLGHIFHGNMPVSIMSACGMLGVAGVIVNDTLVLVDRINELGEESGDMKHAVTEGGCSRFRAIFLTQITTFVGLVPLIFNLGPMIEHSPPIVKGILEWIFGENRSAQSTSAQFLTPMSVAMGYGSLTATLITLYLVPMCYLVLEDLRKGARWLMELVKSIIGSGETSEAPAK